MKAAAGAFTAVVGVMLAGVFGVVGIGVVASPSQAGVDAGASPEALVDIPADVLVIYQQAADRTCKMSWQVLAAVGKVESEHGRSTAPGVRSGANQAGAMGPMQFLAGTWAAYGLDGDGDGQADVYNLADAIWGAANYLCANGAGDAARLRDAIWAYNRASWYVDRVLEIAARYTGAAPIVEGDLELVAVDGIVVAAHLAPQLRALLKAASADGIELGGSGYRPTHAQIQLRLANGCPDVYSVAPSACRVPTAIPGHSMHERGEAVDFTYRGRIIGSRANPGFGWLQGNAARFGFYNLPSEVWHWSTNGN